MDDEPRKCFHCQHPYKRVIADYIAHLPGNEELKIADVPLLVCENCGDESMPPEASQMVEVEIARKVENLQQGMLHREQRLNADIAALHKDRKVILKDIQSMGFYLRHRYTIPFMTVTGAIMSMVFDDPWSFVVSYITHIVVACGLIYLLEKRTGIA